MNDFLHGLDEPLNIQFVAGIVFGAFLGYLLFAIVANVRALRSDRDQWHVAATVDGGEGER